MNTVLDPLHVILSIAATAANRVSESTANRQRLANTCQGLSDLEIRSWPRFWTDSGADWNMQDGVL